MELRDSMTIGHDRLDGGLAAILVYDDRAPHAVITGFYDFESWLTWNTEPDALSDGWHVEVFDTRQHDHKLVSSYDVRGISNNSLVRQMQELALRHRAVTAENKVSDTFARMS